MIIEIAIISVVALIMTFYITYSTNKNLKRKYNQRDFELELEKYKFFGSIDTKKIQEEIDNMVNKYFSYYVLYNFEAHQKKYIKKDEMDKAVKDVTKNIVIEMSELYSFYFRTLYNIENEEQLTAKVYELVTDLMIAYASEINKPREEESRA